MIIPIIKHVELHDGTFDLKTPIVIRYPERLAELSHVIPDVLPLVIAQEGNELDFRFDASIPDEGYVLDIKSQAIAIAYKDYRGALYAFMTLIQLCDQDTVSCQTITDYPDLTIRGFMWDISRDKVPTLSTMKSIVQTMMRLKMNHLELYVEGFSLELPSFPHLSYDTPFTPWEYRILERYAAIRGIDLVPNINTFGHMTKWLEMDEYTDLAECPDGYHRIGNHYPPSTINPLDPRSLDLVTKMVRDVLEFSRSNRFNINGDEPFELGLGKSKSACEALGPGKVYVDFITQVADVVIKAKRQPLIWGDVLARHPEILPEFPNNLTVIDWGYDYKHDFDLRASRLQQHNLNFMLAPGTSSWCSFAYRHRDMVGSTDQAIRALKTHEGQGLLMTDWGDYGHPQPLCFSYPGLAYAASETWTGNGNYAVVEAWLKQYVFTGRPKQAEWIRRLGEYSMMEDRHISNGTMAFRSWMMAGFYHQDSLKEQYSTWKMALEKVALSMTSSRSILDALNQITDEMGSSTSLVDCEIRQSMRLIELSVLLNQMVNHHIDHL
ncbi:MAG: family 20 glycosylhydrolase, partial [Candidatus Izemoplasmatales bacterium]